MTITEAQRGEPNNAGLGEGPGEGDVVYCAEDDGSLIKGQHPGKARQLGQTWMMAWMTFLGNRQDAVCDRLGGNSASVERPEIGLQNNPPAGLFNPFDTLSARRV
ncbi:hypothetical protein FE840_019420 (plasmid) [Peteryoungia desertarenae]|uniref:Uncharacterized protein n=1 Tax=Peteryoungia desertarenae TaxID=1813451 RepID=A0ABX6QTK6_9HYPH|nr:hypothetical protein [Peteryoungia desertarenae]QLF71788.1 hypothetical protein FE840_019420 [Peteryoungia desertarenae]